MSVVVKIDRYAIVIPSSQAAALAALLESAKLYERDGYRSDAPWKPCTDHPLALTFCDDAEFAPLSPAALKVFAESDRTHALWSAEYNKRNAAEQRNKELEAELAALKTLRTCAMAPADEPVTAAPSGDEPTALDLPM
jgi:hypothetical protein